jgi:L-lactate utilization protein LutB
MKENECKAMLQRFMEWKNKRRARSPHEVEELKRLGLVDKKGENLTAKGDKAYLARTL